MRTGFSMDGSQSWRSAIVACLAALALWANTLPAASEEVEEHSLPPAPEFTPVRVAGPFEHPWSITFLPDGEILVTERPGRLQLIKADHATRQISGLPPILTGSHAGLLDVALDPDFAVNETLYLSYSHGTEAASTLRVLKARLDREKDTLADQRVIFESGPPAAAMEQLGGRLAVTADGFLFLSLGDRSESARAQDLSDNAGSIIRIRTDGSIPDDNPFVANPNARPETWSYGHRNPQGLAIEAATGLLWSHEHGPQGGDELNLIEPGRNYGWPIITYGIDYDGTPIGVGSAREGLEQPVRYWVPSIAPSGLALRSDENGRTAFVGALAGEMVVQIEIEDAQVRTERHLLKGELGRIRDVRIGSDDLIYVVTDHPEGALYRLEPTIEQVIRKTNKGRL